VGTRGEEGVIEAREKDRWGGFQAGRKSARKAGCVLQPGVRKLYAQAINEKGTPRVKSGRKKKQRGGERAANANRSQEE